MKVKKLDIRVLWKKLKVLMREHLSLTVIVVAALMLQITMAVMSYQAQSFVQTSMERTVDKEMDAINLGIRNKLGKVEVTTYNVAWLVGDKLSDPDNIRDFTYKVVEHNSPFIGCGVAFLPNYFKTKEEYFEPYSARRNRKGTGKDAIITMDFGRDQDDNTHEEYYVYSIKEGKSHWCEPYIDTEGAGDTITTYSVPVHDSKGKIVATVYVDIALDWLNDLMEESRVYQTTQRFILSGKGNLLAGEDCETLRRAKKKLDADTDKIGYSTMENVDGEKQHVFYHPIGGQTDWVLISVNDDSEVFGRLRSVRLWLLSMVLVGMGLLAFIVVRVGKHLESLREVNAEKERTLSELRVASKIQQSMLPEDHLSQREVNIYGSLHPAMEVGGDLFDYFIRDGKLFFCIGDVSGKGAPAAMMMAVIHTMFRDFSAHENNPAHIMKSINIGSCRNNKTNMFTTLFLGVLDLPTGNLRYCNAGHEIPFVIDDGRMTPLPTVANLPVGVFEDSEYQLQETKLEPESTLFMYTDGVTEAKNAMKELFGMQRVENVLMQCTQDNMSPQQILETFNEKVHHFVKDYHQSDDITMLAIRYLAQNFDSKLTETLTLKNNVKEVAKLSAFIKQVTEQLQIEKKLASQLRLAVEEAVVNVIDYAYPAEKEGDIEVRVMSDDNIIKFVIIDSGGAFDPTAKEKADITLSAEDRQIGGLGLLLVRELMDSINYERENGKNILTLMKKVN